MRLQIVPNASSIRFRYLGFSMADVGSVFVSMVNLYNPLLRRCIFIFSFHAKKLYGVRMNSFGNSIFRCFQSLVPAKRIWCVFFLAIHRRLIPCKCG
jgi:hypothetical protein